MLNQTNRKVHCAGLKKTIKRWRENFGTNITALTVLSCFASRTVAGVGSSSRYTGSPVHTWSIATRVIHVCQNISLTSSFNVKIFLPYITQ